MSSPTLEAVQAQIDWLVYHQDTIERALDHANNTATFDDVAQHIMMGKARLYADEDSFVVTEIINLPQAKFYNVWVTGGVKDAVLRWEDQLMVDAHALGCSHLAGAGRKGWERVMKAQGWDFYTVTMLKEVTHGVH